MTEISVGFNKDDAKDMGPASEAPIGAPMGIATIALNMAMKYHDIAIVKDGTMYQQYKMEGRNLRDICLDEGSMHLTKVNAEAIPEPDRPAIEVTEEMIAAGVDAFSGYYPDTASDGQYARSAIAAILASALKLIAPEPMSDHAQR